MSTKMPESLQSEIESYFEIVLPVQQKLALLELANREGINNIFGFFHDIVARLEEKKTYFSTEGFKEFRRAAIKNGIVEALELEISAHAYLTNAALKDEVSTEHD